MFLWWTFLTLVSYTSWAVLVLVLPLFALMAGVYQGARWLVVTLVVNPVRALDRKICRMLAWYSTDV